MKKCFWIFVLLLLSAVAFACAEIDESRFYGVWVDCEYADSWDYTSVNYMVVRPNHDCFWSSGRFYDGSPEIIEDHYPYAWKASGNKLTVYNPTSGGKFHDFYLFDDSAPYLSYREDGLSENYRLISSTEQNQKTNGDSAVKKLPSPGSLCGKWSHYWDARDLNAVLGSNRMNFDIRSYDLFLLDDGSAYLESVSGTGGTFSSGGVLLPGSWTLSEGVITLSLGTDEYRAWLDASGRLFLQMTDSMALIFEKTNNYNYEEGLL